jgi:uncharacterized damage-inducible protein DinB
VIRDLLRWNLDMCDMVFNAYLGDLSDEDLRMVPVPGMNPIAWQLGHLLVSERQFVEAVKPGSCPPLSEEFLAQHPRNPAEVADPSKYPSLAEYKALWDAQHAATRRVIDELSDEDFARKAEGLPDFVPTVGAALLLSGNHPMMHAGQFVAVRRALGKPVSI